MIDELTRLLLLKYQPDSPLLEQTSPEPLQAPVSIEINKSISGLTLVQKIAVAKARGTPQFVIDILTQQLIANLAKENR